MSEWNHVESMNECAYVCALNLHSSSLSSPSSSTATNAPGPSTDMEINVGSFEAKEMPYARFMAWRSIENGSVDVVLMAGVESRRRAEVGAAAGCANTELVNRRPPAADDDDDDDGNFGADFEAPAAAWRNADLAWLAKRYIVNKERL